MGWTTDDLAFRDNHGRHAFIHGINFVDKDPARRRETGQEPWTEEDLEQAAGWGLTGVRLGVIWSAVMPSPGEPDARYLDWLAGQVERCRRHGLRVVLDAHQDPYAQAYSDGAPSWATLTDHPFEHTGLWSDAYLASPAVQESLDRFWGNEAVHGKGLQEHFADFWLAVLDRVGDDPFVVALDLFNEPVPGSPLPEYFGMLLGAFAELTGQSLETVMAAWNHPEAKLAQLERLNDPQLYRALGDAVAPALAEFDAGPINDFYERVGGAIRAAGHNHLILRENSYLSNMGVPSLAPIPQGIDPVAFSPHAYDLVVDTEAITMASNERIRTILERHVELQERWRRPALLGEWGALSTVDGVGDHARFIEDFVDRHLWSHTYWCWEPEFAGSEAQRALVRPHPRAVVGTVTSIEPGPPWVIEWHTTAADIERADEAAVHEFSLPPRDGSPGRTLMVPAEEGPGRLELR